jgi:hypothetical protein
MARGWESKSVEAQQEEAARDRKKPPAMTEAERVRNGQRRTLELARARAVEDLSRATVPAHRRMLEETLRALEELIANH